MNNSEQMPRLANYDEALAHHDSVKPFKSGEYKGLRPLGKNRRYTRARIAVTQEGDVQCTLYGHKVVTYKPNNEIHVSLCGYNTPSTREFSYIVCGAAIVPKCGNAYIIYEGKRSSIKNDKDTMILKDGVIVNAVNDHTYLLNRKAFGEIKKRHAELRKYITMMGKVIEEVAVEELEVRDNVVKCMAFFSKFTSGRLHYALTLKDLVCNLKPKIDAMVESGDLGEFYYCFKVMAAMSLPLHFGKEVFMNPGGQYAKDISNVFDEYLKVVYAREIFDCVELPPGVINGNRNKQYIAVHDIYFNQGA